MRDDTLRATIESYLDDSEDSLETDGFLAGQDITFDQAKVLLKDFLLYVENT